MRENSLKKYADAQNCPVRNVLDRFGDKWSTLVLLLLEEVEVLRFNELHKAIETISQKMLAVTLKSLKADGLIIRKQYQEIPPRVEYMLSARGASLMPHIKSLVQWADTNFEAIEQSREAYNR